MAYQDIGFNSFLTRTNSNTSNELQSLDSLAIDEMIPDVSGSKILGGAISSPDGRMSIDVETGLFKVNDGATDIIQLGVLPEGGIGLIIKDRDGNELLHFTGDINLIQSPNQHFQADFNEERILSKDVTGKARALFGKGNF